MILTSWGHVHTYVMRFNCPCTGMPWRMSPALSLPRYSLTSDSFTSWGQDETKTFQNDAESWIDGYLSYRSRWNSARCWNCVHASLIMSDLTLSEYKIVSLWTWGQAAGSPSSHRTDTDSSSTLNSTTDSLIAVCRIQRMLYNDKPVQVLFVTYHSWYLIMSLMNKANKENHHWRGFIEHFHLIIIANSKSTPNA